MFLGLVPHFCANMLQLADSYAEILRDITSTEVKSIGNYNVQRLLGEGMYQLVHESIR